MLQIGRFLNSQGLGVFFLGSLVLIFSPDEPAGMAAVDDLSLPALVAATGFFLCAYYAGEMLSIAGRSMLLLDRDEYAQITLAAQVSDIRNNGLSENFAGLVRTVQMIGGFVLAVFILAFVLAFERLVVSPLGGVNEFFAGAAPILISLMIGLAFITIPIKFLRRRYIAFEDLANAASKTDIGN